MLLIQLWMDCEENGQDCTGSARLGDADGLPHDGPDVTHGRHRGAVLAQRLEQRHLVDVLQSSAALQDAGRRSAWNIIHSHK